MIDEHRIIAATSEASELCFMDIATLSQAYRSRFLSPVEVAKATIKRATQIQDRLNPFTFIDVEGALVSAKASESRWMANEPLSPVDGIPTTLKDIVLVDGWTVRYGSHATSSALSTQDAPSVERLRKSGAVFIGQTATPEFGWKALTDSPAYGLTRNPWNPGLTPGGSSGGAAVAAACGAGVLHLGTDGGGSIRIPSSFTGIVGHKPTFGRVAASPPSSFGTVAHIGPMARTVSDAATMLDVMSGRDLRDWTQPPTPFAPVKLEGFDWAGKRIGYWKTPCFGSVDPVVSNAIEKALSAFEALGASIVEVRLPDQDGLLEMFYRHWYVGAANRLLSIESIDLSLIDPGFLKAARIGRGYDAVERMRAEVGRSQFGAKMDSLLTEYDFIISATVPILPFEVGHDTPPGSINGSWVEWSSFSFPINLSQQPACSVPCGFTDDGLPIGLQIIGARGADSSVLSAALSYEELYAEHFLGKGAKLPVELEGTV